MSLVYLINSNFFTDIPGAPIAYWASLQIINNFRRGVSLHDYAHPRVGLQTSDNDAFIRIWHEVNNENINDKCLCALDSINSNQKWYFHNKGGLYRKWYGNCDYVLNYKHNGQALRDNPKAATIPDDLVFKEQISFSRLGGSYISARYFPSGMTFDSAAVTAFPADNLYFVLSLLNSKVVNDFTSIISPTINVQPGDIGKIPLVFNVSYKEKVNSFAIKNISLSKRDWDSFETSWDFKKHPLI